jgi:hypothetical protein
MIDQIFEYAPNIPSFKASGVEFTIGIGAGTSFAKAVIGIFINEVVLIDSL